MKMKKLAAALLAGALVTSVAATSVSAANDGLPYHEDLPIGVGKAVLDPSDWDKAVVTSALSSLFAKYNITTQDSVPTIVSAIARAITPSMVQTHGTNVYSYVVYLEASLTPALEAVTKSLLANDWIGFKVAIDSINGVLADFGLYLTPVEYSLYPLSSPFGKVLTDNDGNEYVNMYVKYTVRNKNNLPYVYADDVYSEDGTKIHEKGDLYEVNGHAEVPSTLLEGYGSMKIITKTAPAASEGESNGANGGTNGGVIKPTGDNAGTVALVSLIAMASILGVAVIRKKDELF